nr:helix-turn-helix domain-containing protein [uncultured Cohaesibacter sp.]
MENKSFTIGTRVRLISEHPNIDGDGPNVGLTGVVAGPPLVWGSLPISFDEEFTSGHTCFGAAEQGRGWFVDTHKLEVIKDEPEDATEDTPLPEPKKLPLRLLPPQTKKILKHLKEIGSISNVEAQDQYRCRSLSKRICEIQEAGFVILKEWKKDLQGQRYVRYFYDGKRQSA